MLKQDYQMELQEDEDLRCPICEYYFSPRTKPFLLPCNHNLCLVCINGLITNKMFHCPICRIPFKYTPSFKVNTAFLSLVTRILKTKVIYCTQCSKVFNWIDHQFICDQKYFKETNELFNEIKGLTDDCITIMQSYDDYNKMLINKKKNIYEQLTMISNEINEEFKEKYTKCINDNYRMMCTMNINNDYENIIELFMLCKPLCGIINLNVNSREMNSLLLADNNKQKRYSYDYFHKKDISISLISNGRVRHSLDHVNSLVVNHSHMKSRNKISKIQMKKGTVIDSESEDDMIKELTKEKPIDEQCLQKSQSFNENNSIKEHDDESENDYHNKLNKILSISSIVKNSLLNIKAYTQKIEYLNKSIIDKFNKNLIENNQKLSSDFNGIVDNITLASPEIPRQFLINYIVNTKKIWLYNAIDNSCQVKELSFLPFKFNNTISIEYNQQDTIYLTGGKFNPSIFSNDMTHDDYFYIIKWDTSSNSTIFLEFIGMMPRKRSMHSSLFHKNKLYLIGGEGDKKKNIRECECYNCLVKIWELMPCLNYLRIKPSLCIYNNTFLYVFQGCLDKKSYIEYIDISIAGYVKGWNVVLPEDPGSVYTSTIMSSATVIDNNQIMICGGKTNQSMIFYTYIYDPIKRIIYRSQDLGCPAIFSSPGVIHNDILINIDIKSDNGKSFGVHSYNIIDNHWSFL